MSHFTPTEKARKLEQILSQLKDRDQDTNWELLDSFSRVVYAALPDWMAQSIAAPALADRLIDNYRFFVEELPLRISSIGACQDSTLWHEARAKMKSYTQFVARKCRWILPSSRPIRPMPPSSSMV